MKRFTSGLLAAALSASLLTVPAYAASFTDVQGHWAQSAIEQVADLALFVGNEKGEFMPGGTMTRGMFVTVMERTAKKLGVYQAPEQVEPFSDVRPTDYFAAGVAWAQANGLVNGVGEGRFAPHDPISREQMCALMDRFLRTFTTQAETAETAETIAFVDRDQIAAFARESVERCVALGLIRGVPQGEGLAFQPQKPADRAATATILTRLLPVAEELGLELVEPAPNIGGGGGGGGAAPTPVVPEHTEQEKADEARVAADLRVMLDNYKSSQYLLTTEQQVQDTMAVLMSAISDALTQRSKGTFLDRSFVREQYGKQIEQVHTEYDQMTKEQRTQLNNVVVRLGSTDQIRFVIEYFGFSLAD
ncbi:MAG: S-layer homology domain-containing protein [Eubacteriales bacterium]|nr:S-layer homology domain-containing protein [Eubacteriales bacterium]